MMQVKCANGEWVDIGDIGDGGMIEYRKKPPEKKPDDIGYVGVAFADDGCWYLTEAYEESCNVPERTDDAKVSAILKLTQCGETGKLIKAEVL